MLQDGPEARDATPDEPEAWALLQDAPQVRQGETLASAVLQDGPEAWGVLLDALPVQPQYALEP